jgi:hypothetical protein
MKQELIDRQISIKEKQIELHKETQKLLFDLLSRMTPEQKDKLEGYVINDDYTVSKVVDTETFEVQEYDNNTFDISIDSFSLVEQKELIDFILSNNLID